MDDIQARAQAFAEQLLIWLQSPSFLAQVAAIVAAVVVAPVLARTIRKRAPILNAPPAPEASLHKLRDIVFRAGAFLRAILLVLLLALAATALRAAVGQDWLVKIAQGLATVFLVYRAIKVFLSDPFYAKIATWTLVPLSLILVLGYWDDFTALLGRTVLLPMGDNPITALTVSKLAIFGALFFWLGSLGNKRGQDAIRAQESLDIGVREIAAKLFQIVLFAVVFFVVMSAAGIPLSGLAVAFGAVGLGIGLGLQPIAANFVSGLIVLLDRSVRVGDYVMLEDGRAGTVEAINMRSTTVETADGKDIMVPNTLFIEQPYENWTHKDPRQRYEVGFSVAYDTDLDALEAIIVPAVLAHPQVLSEPELPDLEFRGFGESGIDMAIEFWCEGIDDGPNKFTSDVGFILWRTLKAHAIAIPYPQRVVHQAPIRNTTPPGAKPPGTKPKTRAKTAKPKA